MHVLIFLKMVPPIRMVIPFAFSVLQIRFLATGNQGTLLSKTSPSRG